MVQIPDRRYKSHQIFSMVCCLLIVVSALFLPWIKGTKHTYGVLTCPVGIVLNGGTEKFVEQEINQTTMESSDEKELPGEEKLVAFRLAEAGCVLLSLEVLCYAVYFVILLVKKRESMRMVFFSYYGTIIAISMAITTALSVPEGRLVIWTPLYVALLMFSEHFFSRLIEASIDLKRVEREKILLMNQKNELLEKNYREILALTQESRKIYHDFKNEINVLTYYAEQGNLNKVREYLKQIGTPVRTLEAYTWTGNEMIDLILNRKYAESLEEGILFQVDAVPVGDIKLGELQICSVFGNLLDNAIEAAKRAEEGKKWVRTELAKHGGIIQLTIRNSYAEEPIVKGGRFLSRKKASGIHGLGIENVRMVVEECGGDMQIEFDTEKFEVCVTFYSGETE